MHSNETRGSVIISDTKRRVLSDQEEQVALDVIENIMSTLGKLQQYPPTNEIVLDKMDQAMKRLHKWHRSSSRFECVSMQGNLQINNAILSLPSQEKDFVQAFLFYLTERNVRTLEILDGVTLPELQRFFQFFSKPAKEIVANKNITRALKRMGIKRFNLSAELVLDDVVVKTEMSDALSSKLSQLNVDDLLEKANIISQLDMNTLHKVGDLATMVTNLSFTHNDDVSNKILKRLANTLHGTDQKSRLSSAKTFSQIADKAMDYTLFDLHSEVGTMMAEQAAREQDPQVFSTLAKGLEKAAQIHIAQGNYEEAMKIVSSVHSHQTAKATVPALVKNSRSTLGNIAKPGTIKRLIGSLESDNLKTRDSSVTMLSQLGESAVPKVIDLIYTTENEKVLEAAVKILMEIGPAALTELYVELKEDMDFRFRVTLIRVIGEVGDVHSLPRIIPFLLHENEKVVDATFRAMLKIGGQAAETKILANLVDGTYEKSFFQDRLRDFGAYKNSVMVPHLVEFLAHKGPLKKYLTPENEVEAVNALGYIGGADSVAGISEVLLSKKGFLGLGKRNEKLETAACNALRRIGDPKGKKALKKAAKSNFKKVQVAAELALKHLDNMVKAQKAKPEVEPVDIAVDQKMTVAQPAPPAQPDPIDAQTIMEGSAQEPDEEWTDFDTSIDSLSTEEEPDKGLVRILLSVGSTYVDNVLIIIPGIDNEGKKTAGDKGAEFRLDPGDYEILIKDQGMEIRKRITVLPSQPEIRLDLQDIFNF